MLIQIIATMDSGTHMQNTQTQVRAGTEEFTYDFDGNLTSDSLWIYRYDALDRLVEMIARHPDASNRVTGLRFTYDYKSRRVAKAVYDVNGYNEIDETSCRERRVYLYDGWTLLAEYAADKDTGERGELIRTYTWGLDLEQTGRGF